MELMNGTFSPLKTIIRDYLPVNDKKALDMICAEMYGSSIKIHDRSNILPDKHVFEKLYKMFFNVHLHIDDVMRRYCLSIGMRDIILTILDTTSKKFRRDDVYMNIISNYYKHLDPNFVIWFACYTNSTKIALFAEKFMGLKDLFFCVCGYYSSGWLRYADNILFTKLLGIIVDPCDYYIPESMYVYDLLCTKDISLIDKYGISLGPLVKSYFWVIEEYIKTHRLTDNINLYMQIVNKMHDERVDLNDLLGLMKKPDIVTLSFSLTSSEKYKWYIENNIRVNVLDKRYGWIKDPQILYNMFLEKESSHYHKFYKLMHVDKDNIDQMRNILGDDLKWLVNSRTAIESFFNDCLYSHSDFIMNSRGHIFDADPQEYFDKSFVIRFGQNFCKDMTPEFATLFFGRLHLDTILANFTLEQLKGFKVHDQIIEYDRSGDFRNDVCVHIGPRSYAKKHEFFFRRISDKSVNKKLKQD